MPAHFGHRLHRLRTAAGLTLDAVAERMGAAKQRIFTLERRERPPTIETTQALAAALGCDPSELDGRLAPTAKGR